MLYTQVTGAGLEKLYSIWRRYSLEIVWTVPERLHDAKLEWRGRVTIAGYC